MKPNALRQPTLYIPHGAGPCFFMDWNPADAWDDMAEFLRGIANTLPEKPKAIVVVSAHWLSTEIKITGAAQPELIYDYYGFPPHTYELTYPAAGQPELAQRMAHLLNEQGLSATADAERGFDHGLFIPFKLMFPEADIPMVQLSLRHDLDPAAHIAMGQALASLRDEGVLMVGSGMSFHNMRAFGNSRFGPISDEFDAWLTQTVSSPAPQREALLTRWFDAPQALQCHPLRQEEHLMPLMVVAGAATGSGVGKKIFTDRVMETTQSAFRFD